MNFRSRIRKKTLLLRICQALERDYSDFNVFSETLFWGTQGVMEHGYSEISQIEG